jgi:hypothetical protein
MDIDYDQVKKLPVVISGHLRNAAYANIDPRA